MKLLAYFFTKFLVLNLLSGVCCVNDPENVGDKSIVLDLKNIDPSYFKIVKINEILGIHPEIFRFELKPGLSKVVTQINFDRFNIWERNPDKNDLEFHYFELYNTRNTGILFDVHTSGTGGGETFQFSLGGGSSSFIGLIEFYWHLIRAFAENINTDIKFDVNDRFDALYHPHATIKDNISRYQEFNSFYREEFVQITDGELIIWDSKSPYDPHPNVSTHNDGSPLLSSGKQLSCKSFQVYRKLNLIHLIEIRLENGEIVYFKKVDDSVLEHGQPPKFERVDEEEFVSSKTRLGFDELMGKAFEKISEPPITESENSFGEIDVSMKKYYLNYLRRSLYGIRQVTIDMIGQRYFRSFNYEGQNIVEYRYGDVYRINIIKSNEGTKYIEIISMTRGNIERIYFAKKRNETAWKKFTNYDFDNALRNEINYKGQCIDCVDVKTIVDDLPSEIKIQINPEYKRQPSKYNNKKHPSSPTNVNIKGGGLRVNSSFKINKSSLVLLAILLSLI